MPECHVSGFVDIDAPPERVWEVLADSARYPEWNRFMPEVRGEFCEGCWVRTKAVPRSGLPLRFRAQIATVDPPYELRWKGKLGVQGLFDGDHTFRIHRRPDGGSTFSQHECLSGLLVPLLGGFISRISLPGFNEMNLALKHRAEEGS